MSTLADMPFDRNRKAVMPLAADEIANLRVELPHWHLRDVERIPQLDRRYRLRNFAEALAFTNAVGALAEQEDHHPQLVTSWGQVEVAWWTHSVKGLHLNDFIMAARCDALYPAI